MSVPELPDFGAWEVVEKLGEGGQCAVFRVRDRDRPDVERAIKVMFDRSPNALERFVAEAQLLMQIDHPNVLKVHSLDAEARPPWIVMELLAGRDLDEERQLGPIEPERAAQLIADVASGLAEVHRLGVRHRDIKPANVMVGHDGVPRLIDFGIAREVGQAHLTQAGMVIGTVAYMPPELFDTDDIRGVQDTAHADVYALGQTLYEILVGDTAYPREGSTTKLLALVMKEKLERPWLDPRDKRPQVPEELAAIVRGATSQQPEGRIQTAEEFEKRLRDWLAVRLEMNTAPVSRMDPSLLPPPTPAPAPQRAAPPPPPAKADPAPKTAPKTAPTPRKAPDPPARTGSLPSQPAYEDPEPRRSGGSLLMFFASGVGTATALGLVVVLTLAAVGALWALRPTSGPAFDPAAAAAAVQPLVGEQAASLAECAFLLDDAKRASKPQVVVRFDLVGGAPTNVAVERGADPAVDACVLDGVKAMRFAGAPDVPVQLPIDLR